MDRSISGLSRAALALALAMPAHTGLQAVDWSSAQATQAPPLQEAANANSAPNRANEGIQNVIVTAQRHPENVRMAAWSLAALSADTRVART